MMDRSAPLDYRVRLLECESNLVNLYSLEFRSIFVLGMRDIYSLLSDLESGIIQNNVKCLILDNMPYDVQEKYWNVYENV